MPERMPSLQTAIDEIDAVRQPVVYRIDPLTDRRWNAFLERHARASVFHSLPWLKALHRTYGYEPIVLTTTPSGAPLQNGIALCRVNSWLTGRRMVSVPFADHCEPLVDDAADLHALVLALEEQMRRDRLQYVEIRPMGAWEDSNSHFHPSYSYCLHQLDLTPNLDTLFRNCHKDSTQRKIRRAEREGLIYEEGRSVPLLDAFFDLLLLTRRRHQLPPQPRSWFQNLIECFGEALKIRVAFKDKQPVAAILTLRHKGTLLYKYGCSDARFNNLGGMHLLLWRSIQEAKECGLRVFDLGRSDYENTGLITFKDRWGTVRSSLTYGRAATRSRTSFAPVGGDWKERIVKRLVRDLPDRLLCSVGAVIYKHIG
jgi:CelD/BcsL family acetyltransferase involved in cellulose biosynthesis